MEDIVGLLNKTNSTAFTVAKTIEECNELTGELIKYFTKYDQSPEDPTQSKHFILDNVAHEIADVMIRLSALTDELKIQDLVDKKLSKKIEKLKTYPGKYNEF